MNDIMIGTWAWGTGANGSKIIFGNKADKAALTDTFATAVSYGFMKWDTAAVYGMGSCETFLGKLIENQKDIFLSTKYAPGKRFKFGELTKSFEESCIRLWNNQIDYYAYMVMEQGALSGHYDDKHTFPMFSMRAFAFPKSKFKRIAKLLDRMREMAQKYDIDASQIPVLWVIGKGAIPIVGLTKPAHAEKLYKASDISLTAEEMDMLEKEAQLTGIRQQGSWEPQ
jgi:aryl-alcohol dehydrogenase-like predicted oxidoreductase